MCTHPTCKNKKGHTLEHCWTRARELTKRADAIEAQKKGKEKANVAEEASEGAGAAAFAGNASTSRFDPSNIEACDLVEALALSKSEHCKSQRLVLSAKGKEQLNTSLWNLQVRFYYTVKLAIEGVSANFAL